MLHPAVMERPKVNIAPQGGSVTQDITELGPMKDITDGELEEYREQDVRCEIAFLSLFVFAAHTPYNSDICPLQTSLDS
jgi:hypothetical protein